MMFIFPHYLSAPKVFIIGHPFMDIRLHSQHPVILNSFPPQKKIFFCNVHSLYFILKRAFVKSFTLTAKIYKFVTLTPSCNFFLEFLKFQYI